MQVPSTPTSTDLLKFKHELELAINRLKSAKEVAEGKTKQAVEFLESILGRTRVIEDKLKSLDEGLGDFVESSKSILLMWVEVLRDAAGMADQYVEVLKKLDQQVKNQTQKCEDLAKQQQAHHETMAKESEQLDRLRHNLKIYQERLEKFRDQVAPAINIIV